LAIYQTDEQRLFKITPDAAPDATPDAAPGGGRLQALCKIA